MRFVKISGQAEKKGESKNLSGTSQELNNIIRREIAMKVEQDKLVNWIRRPTEDFEVGSFSRRKTFFTKTKELYPFQLQPQTLRASN